MVKLSQLGEVIDSAQSGFASGERSAHGVVQLRMNNVSTDGNFDWSTFIRVPATHSQIAKYEVVVGDVLFNATNSPSLVGKAAVYGGAHFTEPVVFSNHFVRLRADEAKVDSRYLGRWLTRQWQRRVFENLCTQWVNQATVRKEDLLDLEIPLPPLSEQLRIAALLDKADHLRRTRHYAAQLSDTFLQAVFLRMFGDVARNPLGWEIYTLRDVATKFSDGPFGSDLKTEHYTNSGVRVIRLQNVGIGELNDDDQVYISQEHFDQLARHRCEPGDVIVGTLGEPNLRACILPPSIPIALNKADCTQIRVDNGVANAEFVCWLLNTPSTLHLATGMILGETRARISMGRLAELRIPVPPLTLQREFARIVQRFERLRAQQREAQWQAEHLFETILHRTFDGAQGQ